MSGLSKKRHEGIRTMANLIGQRVTKKETHVAHSEPGRVDRSKFAVIVRTEPITWLMPFDEVCFSRAWRSQMMLRMMPWDDLVTTENTYLLEARTKLWNDFHDMGLTNWAFMLDTDVATPPHYLHALLEHARADPQKKVLAGWYRVKGEPFEPVVYHFVGDKKNPRGDPISWWKQYGLDEIKTGLEKVDGMGAGCILIHHSVVRSIGRDPFVMHGGGEDLQLCKILMEKNIPVWLDWDLACAHVGVGTA